MSELDELRAYALAATRVITDLAGGGSELFSKKIGDIYTADLAFCRSRVRDREAMSHELLVRTIKEKQVLSEKVASL